jgi:outer membrane protein insertion porin family
VVVVVAACAHPHPRPPQLCGAGFAELSTGPATRSVAVAPLLWSESIESVQLVGVGEPLVSTLRAQIATRAGMAVAEAPIRDDLKRLYATGVIADARVDLIDDREVVFAITPRALIRRVVVAGGDAELARRFRWLEGGPFEPSRIVRMTTALETHYTREGRLDAAVVASSKLAATGIDVCIAANLGPKITIASIAMPGSRDVPYATLLAAIHGAESKINHVGGTYDADALETDRRHLHAVYLDAGYADATTGPIKVERRGRKLAITIPITEGPRYTIGKITSLARSLDGLGVATGDIASRKQLWAASDRLQQRLDADWVSLDYKWDKVRHVVDVDFVIHWRWPWDALRAWRSSPR